MRYPESKFFKIDGDTLRFTGQYMEMYIPKYYFDKAWAEQIGDNYKVFGLVNIRVFKLKSQFKLFISCFILLCS